MLLFLWLDTIVFFVFIVLQSEDIRFFLEEATALDPRFKNKMENNTAVWERIEGKLLANSEQVKCHSYTNIYRLPQSLTFYI